MLRRWVIAVVAASLYAIVGTLSGVTGLVRTVTTTAPGRDIDSRRVDTIDLDGVDPASGGPAGVTAKWRGFWDVRRAGLYDLALASQGRASWTIDGVIAHERVSGDALATRTVWLDARFHEIEITYAVDATAPRLVVQAAEAGRSLAPLTAQSLKPGLPRNAGLRAVWRVLHAALGWVALAAAVLAVRKSAPVVIDKWLPQFRGPWRAHVGRALAWTALAGILVHGALLRIDAITGRYEPVRSPAWLAAIQTRAIAPPEAIRPASFSWELEPQFPHRDGSVARYRSDPHTYLDAGRTMTWFYAGHPREPVFVYVTSIFLDVLDGQDVAVSFASTFFSVLAIWFTYLLGAAIWSRPAGLVAALGLSLDGDVISLASLGWRDDAYMAAAVVCAHLALRWWRAGPPGTRVHQIGRFKLDATYLAAAAFGVAGALAILTRITAVTFLVPAVAGLLIARPTPWRRQLAALGIAVAVTVLVAGPFFFNCWRVLGDPFYSFNVHGSVYSLAEGKPELSGGTVSYITRKFAERPIFMADTVAQGLTTYPFTNKFHGLNPWLDGLGGWASIASIVGLAVLAASTGGRLLLVTMVGSIVPFAFTWTVDPDYRFTVQAYPFLLIAAGVAVVAGTEVVRRALVPGRGRKSPDRPITWRPWLITVGATVVVLWVILRVSPPWVFAEALRSREDATLTVGSRDATALGDGWSRVIGGSNVSMRVTTGEGELLMRLPDEGDYPATLRMDPFPRPLAGPPPASLPVVDVVLNGSPIAAIQLEWAPDRVGTYRLVLPRTAVRRGTNRLVLRVQRASAGDTQGVALWYVRVHPRQTAPAIAQPTK